MSNYIKGSFRFKNILQTILMPAIRLPTLSAIYIYIYMTPISSLLICTVFNDAVSSLDFIAMNNVMITYNEFKRMCKESSWPKLKY